MSSLHLHCTDVLILFINKSKARTINHCREHGFLISWHLGWHCTWAYFRAVLFFFFFLNYYYYFLFIYLLFFYFIIFLWVVGVRSLKLVATTKTVKLYICRSVWSSVWSTVRPVVPSKVAAKSTLKSAVWWRNCNWIITGVATPWELV